MQFFEIWRGACAAALVALTAHVAHAQSAKAPFTLDWVYSDEGRRVASLPQTQWLSDNTLMIYDSRLPATERALEILNPTTGARRRAVDAGAALASLNTLLPAGKAPRFLSWPQSFDPAGK